MAIDAATLGAAIKRVRELRGMTQVELAKDAGLSHGGNSLAMIEQGRRSVSMETLNAIATSLNIPPACLAVLGSNRIDENEAATAFMVDLQKLIAHVLLVEQHHAEGGKPPKGRVIKNAARVRRRRVRRRTVTTR
jgi:transcriptional regulator with XRE-family HTH domain